MISILIDELEVITHDLVKRFNISTFEAMQIAAKLQQTLQICLAVDGIADVIDNDQYEDKDTDLN